MKRAAPELTSVPIMPSIIPKSAIPKAVSSDPLASTMEVISPSMIREKYSAGPKVSARLAKSGADMAMKSVPTVPAKKLPIAAAARARPALPCFAISWPSSVVTTEEASPGRFIRMAVVEPPYCEP